MSGVERLRSKALPGGLLKPWRRLRDAGRPDMAAAVVRGMGGLGDEQSALRGALVIMVQHHRAGSPIRQRAQAGGGSMDDAATKVEHAVPKRQAMLEYSLIGAKNELLLARYRS